VLAGEAQFLLQKRDLSDVVVVSAAAAAGDGDSVFAIGNIVCNKTPIHYKQK